MRIFSLEYVSALRHDLPGRRTMKSCLFTGEILFRVYKQFYDQSLYFRLVPGRVRGEACEYG